jgi:mRNA interferase MazF
MRRGEIWWASIGDPLGSGPGYRRPVLIVQANPFNESTIRTTICAAITSNLRLANAPGNVRLGRRGTGLARDSVVNVSQLLTLDKSLLSDRIGRAPPEKLGAIEAGLRLALSL